MSQEVLLMEEVVTEVVLEVLEDLANLGGLRKLELLDLQGAGLPWRLTHYPLL